MNILDYYIYDVFIIVLLRVSYIRIGSITQFLFVLPAYSYGCFLTHLNGWCGLVAWSVGCGVYIFGIGFVSWPGEVALATRTPVRKVQNLFFQEIFALQSEKNKLFCECVFL